MSLKAHKTKIACTGLSSATLVFMFTWFATKADLTALRERHDQDQKHNQELRAELIEEIARLNNKLDHQTEEQQADKVRIAVLNEGLRVINTVSAKSWE